MIAIGIRFLTGRYHATPWDAHVNEGAVEWPPAPWRILRTLTSSWLRHARTRVADAEFGDLLEKLAAPPRYWLPAARTGHTRHFMPWRKQGKETTTLVLDSFAVPGREAEVQAIWQDAELSPGQRDLLADLLARTGHLGRAESWCDLALIEAPRGVSARPLFDSELPSDDETEIRLLASDGRPELSSLLLDTAKMRSSGRAIPPGTRWVRYALPARILDPLPRRSGRPRADDVEGPALARFSVHAPAFPHVRYTLYVAEDVRRALMSRAVEPSTVFSGRSDGSPRGDGHRHAFFLPTDEDGDGRIDHLTVFAEEGFGPYELKALRGFQTLFRPGRGCDLSLLLQYVGGRDDLANGDAGCCGTSTIWESATPFCLVRHPKRNGRDGPIDQVRRELARRGFPALVDVEVLEQPSRGPAALRWRHFRRIREGCPPDVNLRTGSAFGFRLRFERPVRGPIALGYACHFGLGLFRPA
ncbi:MAG: type I-U CRISPR-associated protein Csb2 [Candidatus Thermoplasmatota archaeon]